MRRTSIIWSLIGILQLVMFLWLVHLEARPIVVSFDKDRVVGLWIRQLAEKNATDAEVRVKSTRFKKELARSLKTYSEQYNVVILDAKSQFSTNKDITALILKRVMQQYRGAV